MEKRIHLICNAHLDPVWQWEWEEGAAETLSTFRIAAGFCEEYGDFVFNHNEAILYRWIEEYEPKLFIKIQKLVKEGKWHIMGGWHLQPDCNMPSGEGFVRQALEGRRYFKEKFGVTPTTAINFDPFGHTRGLVQILAKSGYDSYMFCRPSEDFCHLPSDLFSWVGYDGSEVMARRAHGYNSGLGHATDKIKQVIDGCPEDDFTYCLWGVGNHGGGPSKIDLDKIAELQEEMKKIGVKIIHSTPEDYFKEVKDSGRTLPKHEGDINLWAPGCYTSQIRIKQKYRQLENTLFMTERMCAAAEANGLMAWPQKEFSDVTYDLLTAQFHDFLPGSSVQPAEEMAIRVLDHGLEILSRVKGRAFFALSGGQKKPESDEIPILIYNPHPYPVESDFECEMMLWDQNWNPEFSMPQVYQNENKLPTQCEKENSNLNLDWRKRVVFHTTLEPMQMNRFDCKYTRIPSKPVPSLQGDDKHYIFRNQNTEVYISKETGYIDRYVVNGKAYLKENTCSLDIIQDNCDPWGMTVISFPNKTDTFRLLSPKDGSEFSGIKTIIPSVRVIEDGEVRTVVEALFGYNSSRAVIRYTMSKTNSEIKIDVRLQWAEIQKMVKLSVPTLLDEPHCFGQVAYGEEELPVTGRENITQKYLLMNDNTAAVSVINDCIYGSSSENGIMKLTLLRSPAYTAHPIGDRDIIPQDRFTPHIDQGERFYSFIINAGGIEEIKGKIARSADIFNEKPMALSFYPSGEGEKTASAITLSGSIVQLPVFKKALDGKGYIIRLFNPSDKASEVTLTSPVLKINEELSLKQSLLIKPFEIKTLRIADGRLSECMLTE
ncbi:MAG: alpha-mannosidase [Clostridia bacterium]|nr:alpha-mannosidase [Clostridia bacterium]